MYEFVPILKGAYFTYTEYATAIVAVIFAVIAVIFFVISHLLKCFTVSESHSSVPTQLFHFDEAEGRLLRPGNFPPQYTHKPYQENHSLEYLREELEESGCLNWLVSVFNWAGWTFLAAIPIALGLFRVILTPFTAGLIMFFILFRRLRSGYRSNVRKLYDGIRMRNPDGYTRKVFGARSTYRKGLFCVIITSIAFPTFFQGGCISFYEEYVGLYISLITMSFSTTMMRYFQLKDACPPGPPCHVYATLPEDATTGVFINLHTHDSHYNVVINYDTKDYYEENHEVRNSQTASTVSLSYLEQRGRRAVHSALLDGLAPETRYYIQIQYDGAVQSAFDYVTLPAKGSTKDIVISTGGDWGDRSISRQVTLQAGTFEPDVIVVGGDVSYDDGEHNCYFAWDDLFKTFTLSTVTSGRLIPFLFSVGNHDVGLNAMSGRKVEVTEKGPLYMVFFPQHTVPSLDAAGNVSKRLPNLNERRSYHYHTFGNILHMNLDDGYISNFDEQVDFINNIAGAYPDYIKISCQHNPTYYSCSNDQDQAWQETRAKWVPLYDKYRFMVVFENHEHTLKKTFPLTANQVNVENGTYYLGNGNWGAQPGTPTCDHPNNSTGVLEYASRINHFWLATISNTEGIIEYTPYNSVGAAIIPTFTQEIDKYVL